MKNIYTYSGVPKESVDISGQGTGKEFGFVQNIERK
jgi:hypothetical protein